jgi:hypothetical protein
MTDKLRKVVTDAQAILAEYIVPDSGISDHECINRLLGLLDGPQSREALSTPSSRAAIMRAGQRETVDDVLAVVESYGPWGNDIREDFRFQIVLADEVKRLRIARDAFSRDASELQHELDTLLSASSASGDIDSADIAEARWHFCVKHGFPQRHRASTTATVPEAWSYLGFMGESPGALVDDAMARMKATDGRDA